MARLAVAGAYLRKIWDGGIDALVLIGAAFISASAWEVSEALGKLVIGLFCLFGAVALVIQRARPH